MPLILPYTVTNGENADALEVQGNFNAIKSYVDGNVILSDGTVAMRQPLLLPGDPVQPNQASNKDYVDHILPIGIMMPWPAATAPAGSSGTITWMLCNGASLAITSYHELFDVIQGAYGTATAGNFLLPNLIGRTLFGYNSATGATVFKAIGEVGGTFTVPVPPHAHPMPHVHPMPHTHEMPHLHSIAHDHGSVTSTLNGNHAHDVSYLADGAAPGGSTARLQNYSSTGLHANSESVPSHSHNVDVPNYTGNSGQPDDATTDASSAADTAAENNHNTSNNTLALTTSGSVATTQIQPYVTVNYIIRVK